MDSIQHKVAVLKISFSVLAKCNLTHISMLLHLTAPGPSSGDLRLVQNGFTSSYYRRGRLEVYYNGQWGTVCIDGWTQTNTRVACCQLGFSDAASSTSYRTSSAAG